MWSRNRLKLFALALGVLLVGTTLFSPAVSTPVQDPPGDDLVRLGGGQTAVWPYVSPGKTFERRASSVNVVVRTDADRVVRTLQTGEDPWNRTDAAFTEDEASDQYVPNGSNVTWADAIGSKRYIYYSVGEDGTWTAQTAQLQQGDYFGGQHHVRIYDLEQADEDWTVMQAHAEHWDWFTLTHTVDSLEDARGPIEEQYMAKEGVSAVQRVYFDNGDRYDHDGWTTIVYLALLPLVGAATATAEFRRAFDRLWTRRTRHRVLLFLAVPAVLLGVRVGGITVENLVTVPPDAVVAVFYPILVVGTPLVAYVVGSRLDPVDGFLFASLGFGTGVVLDYGLIGVSVLPIELVLHRVGAAVAIGLVAAGATSRESLETDVELLVGLGLWIVLVVAAHVV
ncbi:hypothetical protein [Haloarchaeobius sp. TZWWS8]|uniref:hypothetical protein n=1 Tax=Haloarchaeobius sp. TZWWS8 TaxID=3446121 RepID=UPI003EB89F5D